MSVRIPYNFSIARVPAFRGPSANGLAIWLRAAIVRWRQRRLLEMLDERMLHDIGISRSQALAEARKPWWRE